MEETWGESNDSFVVDGLFWVPYFGIALLVLVGGAITAAKGRWGWLLLGLLTSGLIWPVAAFMPAAPGSAWERIRGR